MRHSLFGISSEFERALQEAENWCFDNDTDELPDHITERLFINENELGEKLKGYYHKINEFEAVISQVDEEIKRLNNRKNAYKKNIERMKMYSSLAVEKFGTLNKSGKAIEYDSGDLKTSVRRSSKLAITNAELIPPKYTTVEVKEVIKYNTSDIKKALQAGETIEGATIDDSNYIIKYS